MILDPFFLRLANAKISHPFLKKSALPTVCSAIQRALRLLERGALHGMRVNHRRFHTTMAQQLLDRADIIIRLQQMAGETVPKRVRCCPFRDLCVFHSLAQRLLYMRFMEVVTLVLVRIRYLGERLGREYPLPR